MQNSQVTVMTPFSIMWSRSSCEKLLSMSATPAREQEQRATTAVDQTLGRDRGVDQLDVLDGCEQGAPLDPGVILGQLMRRRAMKRRSLRRIARIEIRLARPLRRLGQELQ